MKNTPIVMNMFELFGKGDVPGILNLLSDDVVFEDNASIWIDGKPHVVPFAGTYKGKENIGKFFQKVGETIELRKLEPKKFFENGNEVIGLVNLAGSFKNSNVSGESLLVMFWTFEDGKIKSSRVATMPGSI